MPSNYFKNNWLLNFHYLKNPKNTNNMIDTHVWQGENSDIRYSIQSVNPNSGLNFFYIFPETGRITVSRPLSTDRENSKYTVRN